METIQINTDDVIVAASWFNMVINQEDAAGFLDRNASLIFSHMQHSAYHLIGLFLSEQARPGSG